MLGKTSKGVSLALGAGFAVTLAAIPAANAAENPFAAAPVTRLQLADQHGGDEGKCGAEHACGADMKKPAAEGGEEPQADGEHKESAEGRCGAGN